MTKLNVRNRTLAVMDNLPFLRSLNNECIDLIAIDPPFAANETFTGSPRPPISDAELAEEKTLSHKHGVQHDEGRETTVSDIWTWDANVHPNWLNRIEDDYPPVFKVVQAVEACASENEAAYIAFMAVRLIECHRVLKPTGSIYVHCDIHADSYLRMLMDAIFGADNFVTEIVWKRTSAHSDGRQGRRQHGRIHDVILFYGKSDKRTWNTVYTPYDQEYIDRSYRYVEPETGRRYRLGDLTGPGGAAKGNPSYEVMGVTRYWRYSRERMQSLIDEGRVVQTAPGRVPAYKRYLDEMPGVPLQDLWTDIGNISSRASERTGYATQKPLALYERIIQASSNPGDVVLDIFAGCATTAVAAENLGRQWVACDMAYRSWTMLKRRFALNGVALSDMTDATTDALEGKQPQLSRATSYTIGPNDLPRRDDGDPEPFHNLAVTKRGGRNRKRTTRSSSWSGRISKDEAKDLLVNEFGAECWGCGWEAPKFPNGEYDLALLEVDHIWARNDVHTDDGGSDELYNLALLHSTCNKLKSNRLTLEQLRQANYQMMRNYKPLTEMVHLGQATQFAFEHITQRGA